jgi:uncharacterized membrane protein/arsenate reductase-like glutaredoxin family protein
MITVTLYEKENCHLCQQVEEYLTELQNKYPHRLVKIDVERENITEYLEQVPILEIGPYQLKAPIEKQKLEMTLGAASDRLDQLDKMQLPSHQKRVERSQRIGFADKLFFWLSKHYMVVFNAFVLLYLGLAFLAPVLMESGKVTPAKVIYTIYSRVCHQLAFRSWFLYGEQPAYPRGIAGIEGLQTYEQMTGLDPFDLETAARFVGNPEMGYKVALCQRDVAIYGGILLFGMIFALTGRKIPSLPLAAWFILGILPIGLDGVSQILSQLPWHIIPIRESTPLLRCITGGLFGFSTAWFGYPVVEESMAETRKVLTVKLRALQAESD